jgi:hypothetical protein
MLPRKILTEITADMKIVAFSIINFGKYFKIFHTKEFTQVLIFEVQ